MSEDCQMSGPCDEHKLFEPFVGTFNSKVEMWMGPESMTSTGVMTNTVEMGGRFLHQSYKGNDDGGPFPGFEGGGFWGYNDVTSKWEGVWVDSVSNQMQTETGDYDGASKTWTMLGQMHTPDGNAMTKKSIIRLTSRDEHEMEMHFQTPDGSWTKGMHIHYTRK